MDPTQPPTDPLAAHATDLDAARDGVWMRIREDEFLVARLDNPRVLTSRAEWLAQNGLPPSSDVPQDKLKDFSAYVFAHAILLDARFKASPTAAYTPSIGQRIAFDDRYGDLYMRIMEQARGDWSAAVLDREAILGNLRRRSPGNASAAP